MSSIIWEHLDYNNKKKGSFELQNRKSVLCRLFSSAWLGDHDNPSQRPTENQSDNKSFKLHPHLKLFSSFVSVPHSTTRWVHMQMKIQSGAGQKALEFTYKLSDLALRRIRYPIYPESKRRICLCGGSEDPTHGNSNKARPLHTIWVRRETHGTTFVGQ